MDVVETSDSVQSTPARASRVRLRPVNPSDYSFLYELSVSPETGWSWRYRDQQPSYETFLRSLSTEVFAQYMIMRVESNERLGLAVCYRANFRNSHAFLALQGVPTAWGRGLLIEGANLFIDGLFDNYEFRKLYAECPEFNVASFRSGLGDGFVEEGVLREHERYRGRWWDLHYFALYRSTWNLPQRVSRTSRVESGQRLALKSCSTFDEFNQHVIDSLNIETSVVIDASTPLVALGLDSLEMFELLCAIEDLGVFLSDAVLTNRLTVGGLFESYVAGWEALSRKH